MRITIAALVLWLMAGLLFVAGAIGTMGCSTDCTQDATCHRVKPDAGSSGQSGSSGSGGSGGGSTCPDDPALGAVASECAIWVSSALGKNENAGTPTEPVQTIKRAVELAQASGPARIYACGEEYAEAVELPAGISLFGGFYDCDRSLWSYEPGHELDKHHPAHLAPVLPGTFALSLSQGDGVSFIGDIVAQSPDASGSGESSIAVFASEDARATFRRSEFIAGNGADGTDGEPGDHNGFPAQKGLPGNKGNDACAMDVGAGGVLVTLHCDDGTTSISGGGGDGGEIAASNGGDGELAPMPNPLGYGAGGKAQDPAQGALCTPGIGGAQGLDGIDGKGGKNQGALSKDGKVSGGKGEDGTAATPGQGGGGGGGAIAGVLCPAGGPKGGAAGGSGGTGGCGGKGGKGGQAGGSSIGIAIRGNDIHLEGVYIVLGNGGRGGDGGVLQPGGLGGLPASGGSSAILGISKGCGGGIGGQGGNGGNGGGGRGGHSVAVAVSSLDILLPGGYELHPGLAGEGGHGGNPAKPETNGYAGSAVAAVVLDTLDPP